MSKTVYSVCLDDCFYPTMTKEQIFAAIAEATGNTPTDVDNAFITKIKETKSNRNLSFWVGTTAEYNAIETKTDGCFYIITDDTEFEDIDLKIQELENSVENSDNNISEMKTKNGQLFYDDEDGRNTIPYSSDMDADYYGPFYVQAPDGGIPLSDFKIVQVNTTLGNVLCNISSGTKNDTPVYRIKGVSTPTLATDGMLKIIGVHITITADLGKVLSNLTMITTFADSGYSTDTVSIKNITGIM